MLASLPGTIDPRMASTGGGGMPTDPNSLPGRPGFAPEYGGMTGPFNPSGDLYDNWLKYGMPTPPGGQNMPGLEQVLAGQGVQNAGVPNISQIFTQTIPEKMGLPGKLANNPMLQLGALINEHRYNNPGAGTLANLGSGLLALKERAREHGTKSQTTVSTGPRYNQAGRDPRTANIKDAQYLMQLDRMVASGQMSQEQADRIRALFYSQKLPGYHYTTELEKESGKTLPTNVQDAMRGIEESQEAYDAYARVKDIITSMQGLESAAGYDQIFAFIRNSDPQRLRQLAETLKSHVVLDEMKRLKALSAQGATGFGAMNEKELDILINSIASLDLDNEAALSDNLSRILHRYKRVAEQAKTAYARNVKYYQQYNQRLPNPFSAEYPAQMPSYWDNYDKLSQEDIPLPAGTPTSPKPGMPSSGAPSASGARGVQWEDLP
jgi:hypothetical protein